VEQLINWTLETIRADSPMMAWLEERRFDWAAAVHSALKHLIIGGVPLVLVTDRDREWFAKYLITTINQSGKKRPFVAVFNANDFAPCVDCVDSNETQLVQNMLSIAFNNRYIYWYIGRGGDVRAQAPKKRRESFMWAMDEEVQDGFFLRSSDRLLDVKLMHLARLFDKTIDAVMFGEVNL
jgi:hypothetical protein